VQTWPIARAGRVIGLLGGSFDPAHAGHAHITREALKRLRLDRVWWLVTPANPIKARVPAPMTQRIAQAQAVINHPKVVVTDIESYLRGSATRKKAPHTTVQTMQSLRRHYPKVTFVWLMGADNLEQFNKWDRWQSIMSTTLIGVFARSSAGPNVRLSLAARRFGQAQVRAGGDLVSRKPAAWQFFNLPMIPLSSSDIRAAGKWRSNTHTLKNK
jgi:nicotinate-nucleotide adenylyltransferase